MLAPQGVRLEFCGSIWIFATTSSLLYGKNSFRGVREIIQAFSLLRCFFLLLARASLQERVAKNFTVLKKE
jgi:hypothetical protein